MRERITCDAEALFIILLSRALPTVFVTAEADVNAIDHLPMVTVAARNGRMVSNGAPSLAWEWQIFLSIVHLGREEASDLADEIYELMHGFEDNGGVVEGVGHVSLVDDISMPSKTATSEIPAGGLTQFDGSWAATVRKQ